MNSFIVHSCAVGWVLLSSLFMGQAAGTERSRHWPKVAQPVKWQGNGCRTDLGHPISHSTRLSKQRRPQKAGETLSEGGGCTRQASRKSDSRGESDSDLEVVTRA